MAKTFIPLSPLDHVFTGRGAYPVQFRFTYAAPLDAGTLESSLKETLEAFPPLRSQLEQVDEFSYGLVPSEKGCTFEVGTAVLARIESVPGKPLVKIQLSEDRKQLSVGMSHAVADGFTYFYFLASWATVSQGKGFSAPFLDRRRLVPAALPSEKITPRLLREEAGVEWGELRKDYSDVPLRRWSIHYPKAELRALTQASRKETEVSLFENDVLCALIAKKASLGKSGPFTIAMPVDFRRFLEEISPFYVGNAFQYARAELTAEDIASRSVTEVAVEIRRSIAHIKAEGVRRSLALLEGLRHQEGLAGMAAVNLLDTNRGLLISNMSKLPLAHLDFGAGPPVDTFFQSPGHGITGILAAKDGLDVHFAEEEK